jgi:hypothetical protein
VRQGQWKRITILIAFMMATSFSTSIFVYAQTHEEQRRRQEQQQQEQQKQQHQPLQQEQVRKQQEKQRQTHQPEQVKKQQEQQKLQQRPTGPTPGGPVPATHPPAGLPGAGPAQGQPGFKAGQTGTPGGPRAGTEPPAGQPGAGAATGQPGVKAGRPGAPGGPRPATQPPAVQPGAGPAKGQPGVKAGRPGTPGGPGPATQPPALQPGAGAAKGQPGVSAGRPGTPGGPRPATQPPTISIKQPPQERQRVLTERRQEIRPEHNARATVRFQSERAKFKPASRVVVHHSPEIHRSVFEKHRFHPETYHARRAVFYRAYRFRTPVWAFRLPPRFGLWDTPALAFIVAHAADEQYAFWYYSHRFDPDVIAWRQEVDRLAAANVELADQLAVMDAKTWELQARGMQVDNSYLPPEMEDIALAAEVALTTQGQNIQAPSPDQPQQDEQYQQSREYQQPAPPTPPFSYRQAADIGFILSAAERKGGVVTLTVRLWNTAADGRSVALYDDSYRWAKSRLIDESGHSYEVREVYYRKGAERISMYDTGKTGIPVDGGATVAVHLVFKEISDGSRRATLNLHPFVYYGRSWTEHDVDFPDITLK